MNVTLSPNAPRYAVSDADDPFKKYWWLILLGIIFTGMWLLTPMMGEKSVGATAIDTAKPKATGDVEQAVASDAGNGIDLSMDGTGKARKEDGLMGSSLFLAPDETSTAPTAGAALGSAVGSGTSASGSTLAGALKKVSEGGGWGEKAQKGFNAPKLAGGSLSGMGAAGGGHAGSSGFGTNAANIGFANTKGLSSGGGDAGAGPASKGLGALKAAAALSMASAANKSNDGARSDAAKAFDGGKSGSKIGGNVGGVPGNYGALDAAPANLKLDDPKLNEKKIAPPPVGKNVAASDMQNSDMAKQIAMQMAGAAIGAAIGGPVGGMVSQVIMQTIQRQADQQQKVRDLEAQQNQDQANRAVGR